jgi:hypothetical protein
LFAHPSGSIATETKTIITASGQVDVVASQQAVAFGNSTIGKTIVNQPGPIDAATHGLKGNLPLNGLSKQPPESAGLTYKGKEVLSAKELTCLKAQIANTESGFKYDIINSIGFVGKYQFGYPALIDRGLVSSTCHSNSQLRTPSNWTGKSGIRSLDDFLGNITVQEQAMNDLLTANLGALIRIGVLTTESPPDDVAGKLAVSHLLGAGGCHQWASGHGGADQYGTTGWMYYNNGRYAITVLAGEGNESNAGHQYFGTAPTA